MKNNQLSNKAIRVFISSTFKDMNNERDYLTDKIFPRIRHEAKLKGVNIKFIDLRWGITEDDAKQGRVVETCLREIENCRPFFIGLLGERYGWIPQSQDLGMFQDQLFAKYDWLKRDVEAGLSITEMEMQYAALRNHIDHAYFYIRSKKISTPSEYQEVPGSLAAEKLKTLKQEIIAQNTYPVVEYKSIEELGQQVYNALKKIVDDSAISDKTSEEKEHNLHEFNLKMRSENYVEDLSFEKAINNWIESSSKVLCIGGDAYTGKSTHMCNFLRKYRSLSPHYKTIYHDAGIIGGQTNMFDRITYELGRLYGWKQKDLEIAAGCIVAFSKLLFVTFFRALLLNIKQTFSKKSEEDLLSDFTEQLQTDSIQLVHFSTQKTFKKILRKITKKKDTIIIFIDNIDLLVDEDEQIIAHYINLFPNNIRFVISARNGSIIESVLRRESNAMRLTVNGFDKKMAQTFASKYLATYSKQLTSDQLNTLLSGFYVNSPYLFSLVLEQLVSFGSFENLNKEIDSFSKLTNKNNFSQRIIQGLFKEFEGVFDINPLICSLYALALSNRGLTEDEIEGSLKLKPIEWSAVRGHVFSLCIAIDYRFQIKDNDIKEAVIMQTGEDQKRLIEQKMIAYFENLIDYEHRSLHRDFTGNPVGFKISEDSYMNQRQAAELPFLYLQTSNFKKLFRYVIFVYNDCYFTQSERLKYWQALYANGYNMSLSEGCNVDEGKICPTKIHSDELVPIKAEYRNYYQHLSVIASSLQNSKDSQWAINRLYQYQDDEVKDFLNKTDYVTIGYILELLNKGKYREVIEYGKRCQSSDLYFNTRITILMISAYKYLGDYSSGLKLCEDTFEKITKTTDQDEDILLELTVYYCNLYAEICDEKQAVKLIEMLSDKREYQMAKGLGNEITYLMLATYGKLYFKLKKYDLALYALKDAYKAAQLLYGNTSYSSYVSLGMLGIVQYRSGDIKGADLSLQTAIEKIRHLNSKDLLLYDMYMYRYFILYNSQQYNEALTMILYARDLYNTYAGKIPQELDWLQHHIDDTRGKIS